MVEGVALRTRKYQLVVIVLLVAGAFALTYYCHVRLNFGTVFTHLFYIPIILAGCWWRRKGLIVAILLVAGLLISHTVPGSEANLYNDFLRAWMFLGVSLVAVVLNETLAKREKDLLDYQKRLREMTHKLSTVEQQEKRKIAQKLHDQISQDLIATKLEIASLRDDLPCERHEALNHSLERFDGIIKDSNTLTFELCPPMLYERGLAPALEWLVRTKGEKGTPCSFKVHGALPAIDEELSYCMFTAVQELLTNAIKYARADHVCVSVRVNGQHLVICVKDDGVGFDASKEKDFGQKPGGFGLFSIRERIGHLGGHFEVTSSPGQGSWFRLVVPIAKD